MFIKKFKKKCGVRGCKNTQNVFLISQRREMGNTVAICRDCLKEALSSTDNYTEPVKVKKEEKPLFPHPELEVTLSSVAVEEPEPQEVIEKAAEDVHKAVAEDTVTFFTEPKLTQKLVDVPPKQTASTNVKKKTNKKK